MTYTHPCLPLELRMHLYKEVLELRRQGLSYRKIIKRIDGSHGIRLSFSHISGWVNREHQPLGNVSKFDGRPSPAIAYVIGTLLSDGYRCVHRARYYLRLSVKDKEYADAFAEALGKVIRKEKPFRPHWITSERRWITQTGSILLFKHLDRSWQEMKPIIEHSRSCVSAFLRAFYDGEGCVSGRKLLVINTDREKLLYVQYLLNRYFGIETTGPHRHIRQGQRFRSPRNGRIYQTKKTCYYLRVGARSLPLFRRHIGFSIKRKQRRLVEATKE